MMYIIGLILFIFFLLVVLYFIQNYLHKPKSPLLESYDKFSRFCGYYTENKECVSNHSCVWNSFSQNGKEYDYCTLQRKILQEQNEHEEESTV